jgi:hypothetical protein
MQLVFEDRSDPELSWTAKTDEGDYDACGSTPLMAVSRLAIVLEGALDVADARLSD